jgi:hypothetical protein
MGLAGKPKSSLAARVLPEALYRALTHVFAQGISRSMLVGGTALAGYYAGHRRSDDLDLFTEDPLSQESTVLAVRLLREIGADVADERSSAHFYHATCRLKGHAFTAQVVLDSNLFQVGASLRARDGVLVADLRTLLMMKAATLVSRGAEKDLYDLVWLFEQDRELDVPQLIDLGARIDGGMNAEALLINLVGTELRESACDFSLIEPRNEVFVKVTRLRNALIQGLDELLKGQAAPPIAALLRKLEGR